VVNSKINVRNGETGFSLHGSTTCAEILRGVLGYNAACIDALVSAGVVLSKTD